MLARYRCAIEFCVRIGKSGSETLQLIHEAYGDDAMRRVSVFKWRKRFRDGETNVKGQNLLFHYPSEACGKRSSFLLFPIFIFLPSTVLLGFFSWPFPPMLSI
jgi:hypothetical protein